MRNTCLLCEAPLEAQPDGRQLHPTAVDCTVQVTDAWGVAVDVSVAKVFAPNDDEFDVKIYPTVDEVLEDIFAKAGLPRLGGASTGRGWSSFSTYQRCPYSWKRKYIDNAKPWLFSESPSLAIGSMAHTFLAIHYLKMIDKDYPLTPEMIFEATRIRCNPTFINESWRVFTGYRLYYQNEIIQPLAIEYDLKDPRTGESCRYDLIAFFPESVAGRRPGTYLVEHKCLAGDEKLFDYASGRLCTVSDFYAQGIAPRVLAYNAATRRMVQAQAEVPQPTSIRDVFEVVLASGQRLRTSDNHPFLTARGWVPAAELTSDDWVAVAPSTAGYTGVPRFTDAQVEFVGLMLGDGCMTNGTFTKIDPGVFDRFVAAAHAIGDQPVANYPEDRAPYVRISMAVDGAGRALLERLGLWGHLAATKFIPDELLAIPDHQVDVLLGALWNTDGCVDVFEERSKARPNAPQLKVRAAYVSRSKSFCQGVQALLQRAGFQSTVTESSVEYKGERRDVWTTKLTTREGKRQFLRAIINGRIPFIRYDVKEALEAIKPGDDAPVPSAYILANVGDGELTGILRNRLNTNRSIERDALAGLVKKHSVDIEAVLGAELRWSRVSHVVISGRSMMYDLTVPGPHTFVVNGIITHNTASRFDGDTLEGWANDGEVIGEVALWKSLGLDHRFGKLEGIIINLLGKQKTLQFHRTLVSPDSYQIASHLDDLKRWEGLIQLSKSTDSFPRARQGCINKYGRCSYFDECAGDRDR